MKPLFPGKSEIDQINRIFKVRLCISIAQMKICLLFIQNVSPFLIGSLSPAEASLCYGEAFVLFFFFRWGYPAEASAEERVIGSNHPANSGKSSLLESSHLATQIY